VGFYTEQVLPRITDKALGNKELAKIRSRVCADLRGEVLEVGFGSGLNVPHYPATVTRVRAVDPATVGRSLAADRVGASPVPVEYVGLDGEHLPLDGDSVDHVVTTWTLCTIADVDAALVEMLRVLRPGGSLHFAEHGRAPDPNIVRWQERLDPLQARLFGGCHLTRPIDELLGTAGFRVDRLEKYYMKGLKPMGFMYEGIATKAPTSHEEHQ
jgi:SAM-dependent methyltransferase